MENSLETLIQWTDEAEESSVSSREAAERDRDYYDNKQWTAEEAAELNKRKQPLITINRVKRKIDFLTGIEKQQRSDPKAFPRNPADEEGAGAASDSIRYVEERNKFDVIASDVWENMLIEGFGGADVGVRMRGNEPEIYVDFEQWDRLFFDPRSSRKDFADAMYLGSYMWLDYTQALKRWPDAKDILDATLSEGQTSDTYDDKPKQAVWSDSKRKRVKIVKMWVKEGAEWYWCIFTKSGKIKGGASPYRTQDGESLCGLKMRSAYVDRENNRYGVVREMISPQDEINKRRSKLLHQLNQRQTMGGKGAVEDVRRMKAELAKPDGHVEIVPGADFQILDNMDQVSGQFNLLQEAKQEIDLMGPNASMTGKSEKGVESGRAIQAQQQGGFIELATMLDGYRAFKQEVYEMIWHLIRQYWTEEKWVRVTDDENNIKFVGLNRPVPIGEVHGYSDEIIQANPHLQQPSGQIENEVARLDVDIMIEDAPDSVTIQHEQFEQIVSLVQAGVQIPPETLIEASQLRNKQKILDQMKGNDDPEQAQARQAEEQKQQQIQETAIQLDFEQKSKDIEKTDAEIRKIHADAAETETEILAPDPVRFNADAAQRAR